MARIERDAKTKRWYSRVQVDGERRRVYGATKREVEDVLLALQSRSRDERLGLPTERATTLTYAQLVDRFLRQYAGKPQSKRSLEDKLKYGTDIFGDIKASIITTSFLQTWLNGLHTTARKKANGTWTAERPLKPQSKRGILKAVRQVYSWGVREGLVIGNPAMNVTTPRLESDSADPFGSWDEVYAIADALDRPHGPMVVFWAATGLRPEEIVAIRWRDVTLGEKPLLRITRTLQNGKLVELEAKNRLSLRTIPLPALAVEVLKKLPRPLAGEELIFPGQRGGVLDLASFRRRSWRNALAFVGLHYRAPRHLRHTFATLALADGVSLEAVSRMLGHSSITTTERHYARFIPRLNDRVADELNRALPSSRWPEVATASDSQEG